MTVSLWFLYPSSHPPEDNFREAVRQQATERGWEYQERPVMGSRLRAGRPVTVLEPRDAVAIYRRAHRAVVGCLFSGDLAIDPDPSRTRTAERLIRLGRYLRYKVYACRLPVPLSVAVIDQFVSELEALATSVNCDGEQDPRVLPLHVFDPETDHDVLDTADGRRAFSNRYGAGTRRDFLGRPWERAGAGAMHGREVLMVAGRPLAAGFHWDVQNAGTGKTRLCTPEGVWEIGRRGHLNVHPDAFVGAQDKRVRRVV